MNQLHPYPWQQGLWQSLCRLAESDRLPHALLLAASDGMGKQHFARTFASWRLCQSPQPAAACGACKSCHLLAAGSHPDLLWISPEADGDKVSKVIKVEQARSIVDFAAQTAQLGGWRIVVLSPAHALNVSSANALLKTLEEPGRRTLFLLLTDQPMALPATIRSRCQLLPLSQPDLETSVNWLREQLPPGADAQTLLALSRGAPLAAAQLQAAPWYQARGDILQELQAVAAGDQGPMQAAQRWQKLDPLAQVTAWQSLLDDAVQLAVAPDQPGRHSDLQGPLTQLSLRLSAQVLLDALWQAVESRRLLDDTSVQPQAILESLWLHWGRETRR